MKWAQQTDSLLICDKWKIKAGEWKIFHIFINIPSWSCFIVYNKQKKNHKEKKEIPASFALLVLPMQQK
jgi:hypothetical protein